MRLAAAASLLLLAAGAWAQKPVLEPSVALGCLTPPEATRGVPEYPFNLYKLGRGGRVKVAVNFPGGLMGPTVDVLEREGEDALVDAVHTHVRKLRVTCLERGEQARLVFEFLFKPTSEAPAAVEPYDAAEAAREKMLGCITSISGETLPDYPERLRRELLQGRLLAVLRFDAADRPPTWELHRRDAAARLVPTIESWLSSLRMPCHEGGPVRLTQLYIFVMEGEGYGFKPLKLTQLMGWDPLESTCRHASLSIL